MQPIAVFTRIKPLAADRTGGSTTAAAKVISSWDSTEGVVEMGGGTMFDHMQKVRSLSSELCLHISVLV
jgi:hypothetical protein